MQPLTSLIFLFVIVSISNYEFSFYLIFLKFFIKYYKNLKKNKKKKLQFNIFRISWRKRLIKQIFLFRHIFFIILLNKINNILLKNFSLKAQINIFFIFFLIQKIILKHLFFKKIYFLILKKKKKTYAGNYNKTALREITVAYVAL